MRKSNLNFNERKKKKEKKIEDDVHRRKKKIPKNAHHRFKTICMKHIKRKKESKKMGEKRRNYSFISRVDTHL